MGQEKTPTSSSFSRTIRTDWLILPSEIQSLKKLEGYLLIPEHELAKIRLTIGVANQMPAVNRAFTLRPGLSLDDIQAREVAIEAKKKEALAGFAAPTSKAVAPMGDGEY